MWDCAQQLLHKGVYPVTLHASTYQCYMPINLVSEHRGKCCFEHVELFTCRAGWLFRLCYLALLLDHVSLTMQLFEAWEQRVSQSAVCADFICTLEFPGLTPHSAVHDCCLPGSALSDHDFNACLRTLPLPLLLWPFPSQAPKQRAVCSPTSTPIHSAHAPSKLTAMGRAAMAMCVVQPQARPWRSRVPKSNCARASPKQATSPWQTPRLKSTVARAPSSTPCSAAAAGSRTSFGMRTGRCGAFGGGERGRRVLPATLTAGQP